MIFTRQLLRFLVALALVIAASQSTLAQTFTDSQSRAMLSIVSAPSPVAGFITYTFFIEPVLAAQEITSIDASFSAAVMNQISSVPSGSIATIFTDNNSAIEFFGGSAQSDSQFDFGSSGLLIGAQSESSTSLSAAFTSFSAIQSSQAIAHVVLPDQQSGAANLSLVVRDDGVGGEGETATFTGVAFGTSAVPEPGSLFVWSLLTAGAALRGHVFCRRR